MSNDGTRVIRTGSIESLYLKYLKKSVSTNGVAKVNIYLTDLGRFQIIDLTSDVLDCTVSFNLEEYLKLDKHENQLKLLDTILYALLKCAEAQGWKKDPFLDAYNECLKVNLKNEWWYKNKLFKSADGKFKIGLYNIYDLEGYILYAILYDHEKKEIGRRIVFKDDGPDFQIEWASWQDSNDTFYFKFKPPMKIFAVKTQDIIENRRYQIPFRTADWFK